MKNRVTKIIIALSFVCLAFIERSEPYEVGIYVTADEYEWYDFLSGRYGDDGRSPNSPMYVEDFKDLDLNTVIDLALLPGNSKKVFFEAGEEYIFGEYDITVPGVKFTSFGGAEDKAIFRGSTDISGLTWTDEGGGVWSTPMAEEPNWIWIDGECAKLSETPRIAITARGSTTTLTITAGALAAYSNVVGSYLVAKDKKFRLSKRVEVTNFASNILTVDGEIDVASNVDLALYNKFEFLTANNEWAWEAGELRVKAAASPATMNIRVSSYDYCFKDSGNTEFSNLEFKEYYQFGVWSVNGVSNIHDCYFHDIRDTGVLIEFKVDGAHVNDNTFERIGNVGIFSRTCDNSTYNGNIMSGIGMQENYGWQTWTSTPVSGSVNSTQNVGAGIVYTIDTDDDATDGTTCEFNDNVLSNIAFNGISLHAGTTNDILRNKISNYMNRFEDGSGIYTFHYRLYNVPSENNEIALNTVFDGNDPFGGGTTIGIYIDNRSRASYIHDNTVYNIIGYGLLLNSDTENHVVEDNKFINCSIAQVYFNDGFTAPSTIYEVMDGVTFNRNTMYCGNSTQRCMVITENEAGAYNPYTDGGADNNYYINSATNLIANTTVSPDRTLAQLQSDYSQDANSIYRANFAGLITNPTTSAVTGDINEYSLLLASASSQFIALGTNADIQFERTDPFAIYFEFKRNGNPSGTELLMSTLGATNRGYQISLSTTGQIILELRNTVTTNRYQHISPTGYADNKIHKVLILKDATYANTVMYIDGSVVTPTEVDNLSATIVNTDQLIFGNRESATAYFNGYLDNIYIWNSDQTANVTDIFSDRIGVIDLAPLHAWKIQTGANDAVRYADMGTSANKLNGTSSGGPTPTNIAVDVDLTPITTYNIPANESLLYLLN